MIKLFTDTDTDVTPALAQELGYQLMSMPFSLGDEQYYPYKEQATFDFKQYYQTLRDGALPKTSALSPVEYREYFEPHFKNGDDILYVHFSAAMSGTFSSMKLAVDELLQEYPKCKFYTIDTKGISILSLQIVYQVANLYKQGKTIDEILAWANEEVDKFAIFFYADNLKFFKRSGRVSGISAVMGDLLDIKPIIHINNQGQMVSLAKSRGRKATLKKIVEMVSNSQQDLADYKVLVAHADALDIANMAVSLLKERFGEDLDLEIVEVNPTIGGHCGPDAVGISFHAKGREVL